MKKVLAVIGAALLFGAIAAGTFFGVKALVDKASGGAAAEAAVSAPVQDIRSLSGGDSITREAVPDAQPEAKKEPVISEVKTGEPGASLAALDVADIVEEAMPSIVAITNTSVIYQNGYSNMFDFFYGGGMSQIPREVEGAGSGVIIGEKDDQLLIATNNHMVEDTTSIAVTFCDDMTVEAHVKGADPKNDIAVIAIPLSDIPDDTKAAIKVAKLHTEHDIRPGQYVIAIGNSLNMGQTVTAGIVSAVDREVEGGDEAFNNNIQTDAAINGGNSGGALLNTKGEVIGINMGKYVDTEVEGVGFSIPIYKVLDQLEAYSNAQTRVDIPEEQQGRLGIYMNTVTSDQAAALNIPEGVIVVGFSDEEMEGVDQPVEYSPAREAGIQKNDIIVKFDGQPVTDADAFAALVKYYEAGREVEVTVERIQDGEYVEKTFRVTLGKRTVTEKNDAEENDQENAATGEGNGSQGQGNNGGQGSQGNNGQGGIGGQGNNGQGNGGQGNNGQGGIGGQGGNGGYGQYPFDIFDLFRQYGFGQ